MRDGFIKVAAGTPKIKVADCRHNAEACFTLMREASRQGVRVLALPELCLTGYTCGDLFLQDTLLRGAEDALSTVLEATRDLDMLTALGLPLRVGGKLYNCAAVIHQGRVLGFVPKSYLPNYGEFYEQRWFSAASPEFSQPVSGPFGGEGESTVLCAQQLFPCSTMPGLSVGVEICEDLWSADPPSRRLCQAGATLILDLSASDEMVGKDNYRRSLVSGQSGRLICGYVYADAGEGESSTDLVFAGHNLIAENGALLSERRFALGLTVSEVDVDKLLYERRRNTTFTPASAEELDLHGSVPFALEPVTTTLTRPVSPTPFVPEDRNDRAARCEEIILLSALGLKKRLEHTHAKTAVVGLSGGLDSTLAVLITMVAMKMLDRPSTDVIAVTMPCFGTTDRTRDNAVELASRLGATLRRIDIGKAVERHFEDIGQSMSDHSVTFENGQARERTQVLMDIANQTDGLVVGTGDLSELALGWATYNGDHMSMYAVNASIPKTLVRHLVSFVCDDKAEEDKKLSAVLADILDTPVSPELLPAVEGKISQKTEDLVGPYELHDFYLYYAIRWGFPPRKVLRLAEHAFSRRYSRAELLKWLNNFYRRFFAQQFKRSCLPDGPKVGSVTLSPRGDWRMPSDAVAKLWLEELEGLN